MCCSVRPGFAVDLVEEADELLMPMAAHAETRLIVRKALTCQFPRGSRQFTATPCRARRLHYRQRRGADAQLAHDYATHKHPRSAPGSNGIRGSIFHFTPISASWLNAVEGFFAKLTKHRLKRGVFKGIADLQTAINRYLVETNDNPKPFIWTAFPRYSCPRAVSIEYANSGARK
jgi:transposase